MNVPMTPLDFSRRAVRLYAGREAVIDGESRYTYQQFGARIARLANALLELGLQPGDRVALLAYNSNPLLEAYYGVVEAGGIVQPLNVRFSAAEVAYILQDSGARFVLVDPDFRPLIETSMPDPSNPRIIWLGERAPTGDALVYEDLLASASDSTPSRVVEDEDAIAELFYTSGTTGNPKGVMLSHRSVYHHALSVLISMPILPGDIQLHTIPLFHVNGWGTPQSLTAVGGTHVMLRKFDPAEALRLVEKERVTLFYAVPTMLTAILARQADEQRDLSSLREIVLGGAPAPPELVRQGERALGCRVTAGYGLSETTPVLSYSGTAMELRNVDEETRIWRQASTGQPVVGVELGIMDPDGRELPWDGEAVGEIVVRSNNVMVGYWGDPDGTNAVIRDGWFHTGDMATAQPNGFFLIVDRKKDIIISGGENISSVEIEKVLYEHPAVLEAAVIGIPDDRWGEVPLAIATLRNGASVTEAEILAFCRSRLSSFKIPRAIEFTSALPKGGTGKILKRDLREPYWKGREKRVN